MAREQRSSRNLLMIWSLVAVVVSVQTLVTPTVASSRSLEEFGEKNTYYPPGSDHRHHGGSHETPACTPSTPSHDGSGHGTPTTPSHGGGGGGGYYSPPSTPAVDPGAPTTPSHGGSGYGYPPPAGGVSPVEPGTPTAPSHGGGGYYSPPTTPIDPGTTPTIPTTPIFPPTPYTPGISTPPSPYTPGFPTPPSHYTPGIPTPPSPLFPIDPNVPPFFTGTCDYWRTHPQVIWGLFGYWGNLGMLLGGFGTPAANLNILDALRNTRTDGVGALYREATASFLNSMVNRRFTFSTQQVRDAFTAALASEQAAANQARLFQRANEGRPRH